MSFITYKQEKFKEIQDKQIQNSIQIGEQFNKPTLQVTEIKPSIFKENVEVAHNNPNPLVFNQFKFTTYRFVEINTYDLIYPNKIEFDKFKKPLFKLNQFDVDFIEYIHNRTEACLIEPAFFNSEKYVWILIWFNQLFN